MKNQQQQAKEMFFQKDMSKTDIAEKLGVSRRTIYQWSVDGDWETLRKSARTMPIMLTERIYYILDILTRQLLEVPEGMLPIIKPADINTITKLTNAIGKLRKGSTVNEDMETFTNFLEHLNGEESSLAEEIGPYIEKFMASRIKQNKEKHRLSGFYRNGTMPVKEEERAFEQWADEDDSEELHHEKMQQSAPCAQPEQLAKTKNTPEHTQQSNTPFRGPGGNGHVGSKREVPSATEASAKVAPAQPRSVHTPVSATGARSAKVAKHIFNHLKPKAATPKAPPVAA